MCVTQKQMEKEVAIQYFQSLLHNGGEINATQQLYKYFDDILKTDLSKKIELWELIGKVFAELTGDNETVIDELLDNNASDIVDNTRKSLDILAKQDDASNIEEVLNVIHVFAERESGKLLLHTLALDALLVLCSPKATFHCKLEAAKLINLLLEGSPADYTNAFRETIEVSDFLDDFAEKLTAAGDYELQATLLECIFRITNHADRGRLCSKWNWNERVTKSFHTITTEDFEADCRRFMNLFNSFQKDNQRVFSYPCTNLSIGTYKMTKPMDKKLKDLWIDFNIASDTISAFVNDDSKENSHDAEWEIIVIKNGIIKDFRINGTGRENILVLKLREPAYTLAPFCPESPERYVKICFAKEVQVTRGIKELFGTLKFVDVSIASPIVASTPSKTSVAKLPLIIRSLSTDALQTDVTGSQESFDKIKEKVDSVSVVPESQDNKLLNDKEQCVPDNTLNEKEKSAESKKSSPKSQVSPSTLSDKLEVNEKDNGKRQNPVKETTETSLGNYSDAKKQEPFEHDEMKHRRSTKEKVTGKAKAGSKMVIGGGGTHREAKPLCKKSYSPFAFREDINDGDLQVSFNDTPSIRQPPTSVPRNKRTKSKKTYSKKASKRKASKKLRKNPTPKMSPMVVETELNDIAIQDLKYNKDQQNERRRSSRISSRMKTPSCSMDRNSKSRHLTNEKQAAAGCTRHNFKKRSPKHGGNELKSNTYENTYSISNSKKSGCRPLSPSRSLLCKDISYSNDGSKVFDNEISDEECEEYAEINKNGANVGSLNTLGRNHGIDEIEKSSVKESLTTTSFARNIAHECKAILKSPNELIVDNESLEPSEDDITYNSIQSPESENGNYIRNHETPLTEKSNKPSPKVTSTLVQSLSAVFEKVGKLPHHRLTTPKGQKLRSPLVIISSKETLNKNRKYVGSLSNRNEEVASVSGLKDMRYRNSTICCDKRKGPPSNVCADTISDTKSKLHCCTNTSCDFTDAEDLVSKFASICQSIIDTSSEDCQRDTDYQEQKGSELNSTSFHDSGISENTSLTRPDKIYLSPRLSGQKNRSLEENVQGEESQENVGLFQIRKAMKKDKTPGEQGRKISPPKRKRNTGKKRKLLDDHESSLKANIQKKFKTSDAGELEMNLSPAESDLRDEMQQLTHYFGKNMGKSMTGKQRLLEMFSRSVTKTILDTFTDLIIKQQSERQTFLKAYVDQLSKEQEQCKKELDKQKQLEEDLKLFLSRHCKMSEEARMNIEKRVQKMERMRQVFSNEIENIEQDHYSMQLETQQRVKQEVLKAQGRLLKKMHQEELTELKKSLKMIIENV